MLTGYNLFTVKVAQGAEPARKVNKFAQKRTRLVGFGPLRKWSGDEIGVDAAIQYAAKQAKLGRRLRELKEYRSFARLGMLPSGQLR